MLKTSFCLTVFLSILGVQPAEATTFTTVLADDFNSATLGSSLNGRTLPCGGTSWLFTNNLGGKIDIVAVDPTTVSTNGSNTNPGASAAQIEITTPGAAGWTRFSAANPYALTKNPKIEAYRLSVDIHADYEGGGSFIGGYMGFASYSSNSPRSGWATVDTAYEPWRAEGQQDKVTFDSSAGVWNPALGYTSYDRKFENPLLSSNNRSWWHRLALTVDFASSLGIVELDGIQVTNFSIGTISTDSPNAFDNIYFALDSDYSISGMSEALDNVLLEVALVPEKVVVPEPTSSISLLALGTIGLVSILKRKQK